MRLETVTPRGVRTALAVLGLSLLGLAIYLFTQPYHEWRATVVVAAACLCLMGAWKGTSLGRS